MIKRIDTNISITQNSNGATITYTPNLNSEEKSLFKVKQAVIKLQATALNELIYTVYNSNNEVIDVFKKDKDGYIAIDITEELTNMLKTKANSVSITVKLATSTNIMFLGNNSAIVNYLSKKRYNVNSATKTFSAKRAGNLSVALDTGNIIFEHKDTSSLFSLNHIYSSLATIEEIAGIPESNCGTGWKLDVQQYLIEGKNNLDSDNETSTTFTYIDGNGQHHNFYERYYYKENDNKIFIDKNQLQISENGEYIAPSLNNKVIKKEIISNSGLILSNSITSIKGSELFSTEPEEYVNLKQQIKENEKNLDFNTKQLILMAISKYNLLKQINSQIESTNLNEEYLDTLHKISVIQDYFLRKERNWNQNNIYANNYVNEKESFTKAQVDAVYAYLLDNEKVITNDKKEQLSLSDVEDVAKKILNEANTIYTFGFDMNNLRKGNYRMLQISHEDNKQTYITDITLTEIENIVTNTLGISSSDYDLASKMEYLTRYKDEGYFKLSFNNIFNTDVQIDVLKQANDEILENMEVLQQQLASMERQIPVHYLLDEEGNVMGFAKISSASKYENVYRLVLMSDAYENMISLNYDSENKLVSITNSEDQEITLKYNDNNLLKSITDERNKKIVFEYSNSLLTKITYPNKKHSEFTYNNADASYLLKTVKSPNGDISSYEYTNQQLTKVTQMINGTLTQSETEISYYDFKSTIITDTKTKKSVTYIFNNLGTPITIYENKFENGEIVGNVHAISYENSNDKKAFSIEALVNVENMLEGGTFTGYTSLNTAEFYLGDDVYCGDDVFLTAYTQELASNPQTGVYTLSSTVSENNKLERTVTSQYLEMIKNSDATDYVLSGWAKADSAWVDRRLTDYSDNNVDDTGLENDAVNNVLKACADTFKQNRRFELRAEIKYLHNGIVETETQFCSFDWLNTNWQYCAFPVTIRKEAGWVLQEIKVFFDYANNTNGAQFFGMSLEEGKWEYAEFNDDKLKIYSENSLDKTYTTYEYNENKKLIKEITYKNGQPYTTEYQYNTAGSLLRTISHDDIVSENVYNDKGSVIKSFTYHKNNPSCKLYSTEKQLDEKGQSTTSLNTFGEIVETSTYSKDTGLLESTTNENGQVTAYGYDYDNDTLLSTTTTIDGEENHTIYEYEDDLLKSLSHNDFKYTFEHDQFDRIVKTTIADSEYSSSTYEEIKETQTINNVATEVVVGERIITTMAVTNEKFIVEKNLDGNIYLAKYINSNNAEFKILENIYDTYGNLVSTKDYANDQNTPVEYQVFLDKYQNIIKKAYTLHGTAVEISNSETETSKTTTFKLGTNTYATTQNFKDDLNATLQSIMLATGLPQTIKYDGLKRINETNLGNIYAKCYNYLQKGDHTSNLVASEWFAHNGIYKDFLKYAYDKKGNIISIKSNGELIASYEYDELSRLTRENNKLLNKTTTFSYDKGGNILQQKEYTYSTLETDKLSGGESKTYAYRSTGWKDQLMSFNGETFEYDNIGNPTTYRNKTLAWARGRQLQSFDGKTFAYNASGIRISKTANGITTNFFLDGTKVLAQQSSNGTLVFLHGADGVIGFIHNSTNYYYKKNIQGDIIAILNANGQEIAKYTYDAWGNHKIHYLDGTNFVAINSNVCYNSSDPVNKQIATLNPFRYRGYYFDSETGLYYLNSRYYDPEIGRFINADDVSVLEATQNNVNGLNLYVYCLNNPVNDIDVNGDLSWWQKLLLGLALIFVGALVTALTAGAGIGFFAAFGSALLTSTIQTGISVAISAGIGMIIGGITTGTWEGALNGLVNGAIDGFMWGGILAGGSQILSGAMKVARIVHGPGKMGINLFNDKLRILSPDKAHFKIPGGTLIKFGKFSLDTGRYALHMHIRLGYLMDKHLMVIPLITSIIELFKKRS